MIPVPSEERSLKQKRFRADPRDTHPDRASPYLFRDAERRAHEQSVFVNSPTNMVHRGLSRLPPLVDETHRHLRMVPPPDRREHPVGRRNPHRAAPFDPVPLFPPGGLQQRPSVVRAASSMETASAHHYIHSHVSHEAPCHPGRRVFPDAMVRSTRGDASLMRTGVKRVDTVVANPDPEAVPGFRQMGMYSPVQRHTGKGLVAAQPWDPVHIFQTYGRRHPLVLPVTTNHTPIPRV